MGGGGEQRARLPLVEDGEHARLFTFLPPATSYSHQFTKQLEGADNRFSVVANYFGLNLFREVRRVCFELMLFSKNVPRSLYAP
jgi:hypothetical protein